MDAKDMTLDELIKRDKKQGRGGARGAARGGRGRAPARFSDRGAPRHNLRSDDRGFRGRGSRGRGGFRPN